MQIIYILIYNFETNPDSTSIAPTYYRNLVHNPYSHHASVFFSYMVFGVILTPTNSDAVRVVPIESNSYSGEDLTIDFT